jgi:hypothetical protein
LLTVDTFLALHGTQLEVLLYDFNAIERPLFVLRFPEATEFRDLKMMIAREAKVKYDPSKDAMELYKADSADLTVPNCSPISTKFTVPFLEFASKFGTEAQPIHKLYFNVVPGMTEEEVADTLLLTIHVSPDGYVVSNQTRCRVPGGETVAFLKAKLLREHVVKAHQEYRVCEEWMAKIYQIYSDTDTLTYANSPIRVEAVTDDAKRLNKAKGDRLCNGCFAMPGDASSFDGVGFPFHFPAFHNDTVAVVKARLKQKLGISDGVWGGLVFGLGDLYKPALDLDPPLADTDIFVKRLSKGEERVYLVYKTAKLVAAKDRAIIRSPARAIRIRN